MRLPIRPPSRAADRGAGQPISRAAARDRGAEQRAGAGAEQGAGVLLRPGPDPVRTAGAGGERKTDDGDGGEFGRGHVDPRKSMRLASAAVTYETGGFGQKSGEAECAVIQA